MRITLEQFQTDFVNGLDSVVVGAVWLQDKLRELDKAKRYNADMQKINASLLQKNSTLKNRVLELECQDKNIYILDTLA